MLLFIVLLSLAPAPPPSPPLSQTVVVKSITELPLSDFLIENR